MSPQITDLHAVLQWYLPWHKARVLFVSAFIHYQQIITVEKLVGFRTPTRKVNSDWPTPSPPGQTSPPFSNSSHS